jgi:hypothetical protein
VLVFSFYYPLKYWIPGKICVLTKVKSKWIKELHIKPKTLNLIEEKVGESLEDMSTWEKFLNRTAMACAVRSRIDKWNLIKLQSFCKEKETVNKMKRPPTDWGRIFTYPKSGMGLYIYPIYIKNSRKWIPENHITPLRMGLRAEQRILTWGILNGWEAPEKMLSILNHQGNANQNNPEIPLHTNQNG